MTAAVSNSPEAEALASMGRSQYLGFKLRQDLKPMVWMLVIFWILDLGSLTYLAAAYVLILALARFDHGRKWDRAHAAPESSRQPGA